MARKRPAFTLDELIAADGPEALARQVADEAATEERKYWLATLEGWQRKMSLTLLPWSISSPRSRALRRTLGIKPEQPRRRKAARSLVPQRRPARQKRSSYVPVSQF
jgi:hypothetical protein